MIQVENILQLMDEVAKVNVPLNDVLRKSLDDYLLDKRAKGELMDNKIVFHDEDDYAEFNGMVGKLGLQVSDELIRILQ